MSYRFGTDYGNFAATLQNTYVSKNNLKTTNEETTPESVYVSFGGNFRGLKLSPAMTSSRTHPRSASLMPAICHLVGEEKKFRYECRAWVRGVKHEEPRSTHWSAIHLPLYSPMAPPAGR